MAPLVPLASHPAVPTSKRPTLSENRRDPGVIDAQLLAVFADRTLQSQRALAVAGARSTLLSLWKVDDSLTAFFMEEFYKRLKAGEGRAAALHHTQAWFRNNKSSTLRDVRVWAAFQR